MPTCLPLSCIIAVITFVATCGFAHAQTVETPTEDLLQGLQSPGSDTYNRCIGLLCEKQKRGDDISAAVPALRASIKQHVDPKSALGVSRSHQYVLLCLIRLGDPEATRHYLQSQDRHFQRTGRPWIHQSSEFLDAIQKSDQWDAFPVVLRQYSMLTDVGNRLKLLYHLARLADDRQVVVRELNAQLLKGNKVWSPSHGRRVAVLLADHPDALTPLVSKFCQPFADSQIKWNENGAKDEAVLIAAMAPFRDDALELLTRWLTDAELAYERKEWFAAYVDSTCRLGDSERVQARERLRGAAATAYAAVVATNSGKPIQYFRYEPVFATSKEELVPMIAEAFKDPNASAPPQPPSAAELSTGLGTSF